MKFPAGSWGVKPLKPFQGSPDALFQKWLAGQVPLPSGPPFVGKLKKGKEFNVLLEWIKLKYSTGGTSTSSVLAAIELGMYTMQNSGLVDFSGLVNKAGFSLQDYRGTDPGLPLASWAQAISLWQNNASIEGKTPTHPPFSNPRNPDEVKADIEWAKTAFSISSEGEALRKMVHGGFIKLTKAKNSLKFQLLDYHLARGREGGYKFWSAGDFQDAWHPWAASTPLDQLPPPQPPPPPPPPFTTPKTVSEVQAVLDWVYEHFKDDPNIPGMGVYFKLAAYNVNLSSAENNLGYKIIDYYDLHVSKPNQGWLALMDWLNNVDAFNVPPYLNPKNKTEVELVLRWSNTPGSGDAIPTEAGIQKALDAAVQFGAAFNFATVDFCSTRFEWGKRFDSATKTGVMNGEFANLGLTEQVQVLKAWLAVKSISQPGIFFTPASTADVAMIHTWGVEALPLISTATNGYSKIIKFFSSITLQAKNPYGDTFGQYVTYLFGHTFPLAASVHELKDAYDAWKGAAGAFVPVATGGGAGGFGLQQRVSSHNVYFNPKPILQSQAQGHVVGYGNDDPRSTDQIHYDDVPAGFPASLDEFTKAGSLGGSTGAVLVKDRAGKKYVMKKGGSPGHIENEIMVDRAYQSSGILVPKFAIYKDAQGKTVKISEFIEGRLLGELKGSERDDAINQLEKGYAMDAFLSNWDVYGAGGDNVLVDGKGQVWRIDNGGALRYRAQGGLKTKEQFNAYTEELWTMRRGSGSAVQAFNGLTVWEMEDSINRQYFTNAINALPPEETELKELLRKRRDAFITTSRHIRAYRNGDFKPDYAEDNARTSFRFQKFGIDSAVGDTNWKIDSYNQHILQDSLGRKYGGMLAFSASHRQRLGRVENDWKSVANDAKDAIDREAFTAPFWAMLKTRGEGWASMVKMSLYNQEAKNRFAANLKWIENALLQKVATPDKQKKWFKKNPPPPLPPPPVTFGEMDAQPEEVSWYVLAEELRVPLDPKDLIDYRTGAKLLPDLILKAGLFIEEWKRKQAGSSSSRGSLGASYMWLLNMEVDISRIYLYGETPTQLKSAWDTFIAQFGLTSDQAFRVLAVYHQLTQELLDRISMQGNDRDNQAVFLFRTASKEEITNSPSQSPIKGHGYNGDGRGVTASYSYGISVPVSERNLTVQAMPRARVVGTYWQRRAFVPYHTIGAPSPTYGCSSFMTEDEAEFLALGNGVDLIYQGTLASDHSNQERFFKTDVKDDVNQWQVPLTTLREKVKALLSRMFKVKWKKKNERV